MTSDAGPDATRQPVRVPASPVSAAPEPGTVLVVDDDPDLRVLVSMVLEDGRHRALVAADGAEALRIARSQPVDVIVADLDMPVMTGLELLAEVSKDEQLAGVPVVVLTAHSGPEDVARALALGAHDYVRKPFDNVELLARVGAALRTRRANARLEEIARTDELTGLANRRSFVEDLGRLTAVTARQHGALALALIDVDAFKQVNDSGGHQQGDEVLKEVALRLSAELRAGDVLARLGGDEFALVMPFTDALAAAHVCERLRHAVAGAPVCGRPVTVSVGCAVGMSFVPELLMQRADDALYESKRGGRDRVSVAGLVPGSRRPT